MVKHKTHIVDKFGRVHDYLRISLTERCNLRCFYCMPEEGVQLRDKAEFMSAEELIQIAELFVANGVKKIRLTGGEPLIKKNAHLIIEALGKMPIELAITTNGVIVHKYIDTFKKAGIKSINVSLDSLKEERFNAISRRNHFKQIKDNIDLLIEKRFEVKINVVVIRDTNEDEIIDFVAWTKGTPVDVRFIEFMPFDGNKWNWDKKVSFKEIMSRIQNHFGEEEIVKIQDQPNDTSRNYKLKNSSGSFGIISSVTNPFCDSCNRIRLTADGKIKNCLFSDTESDLLTPLRKGHEILPIIQASIMNKHFERGGLEDFSDKNVSLHKNRSMTTIGG